MKSAQGPPAGLSSHGSIKENFEAAKNMLREDLRLRPPALKTTVGVKFETEMICDDPATQVEETRRNRLLSTHGLPRAVSLQKMSDHIKKIEDLELDPQPLQFGVRDIDLIETLKMVLMLALLGTLTWVCCQHPWVLALLHGLFFLVLLVSFFTSGLLIRPPYYRRTHRPGGIHRSASSLDMTESWQGICNDPGEDLGLAFENVVFPTAGGLRLRGWLVPSCNAPTQKSGETHVPRFDEPMVIMIHGAGRDRRTFLRHVPILHNNGYATLLFDLRHHGTSDGADLGISMGLREQTDVIAAVNYAIHVRKYSHVALMGTSMGASCAILAAVRETKGIRAVVAENPFTRADEAFEYSASQAKPFLPYWFVRLTCRIAKERLGYWALSRGPVDVVHELRQPLLLMHGTDDTVIPHDHSERLYAAACSSVHRELWIAKQAEHCQLINTFPKEYARRVVNFLDTHFRDGDGPTADKHKTA